jgi:hypothetical protein
MLAGWAFQILSVGALHHQQLNVACGVKRSLRVQCVLHVFVVGNMYCMCAVVLPSCACACAVPCMTYRGVMSGMRFGSAHCIGDM